MAAAVVLAIGIGSKTGLTERGVRDDLSPSSDSRLVQGRASNPSPRSVRPGPQAKVSLTNDTGPQSVRGGTWRSQTSSTGTPTRAQDGSKAQRFGCPHSRAGRAWYLFWTETYHERMGLRFQRGHEHAKTCGRARELAQIAKRKAVRARHRYETWREERFLPETDSWHEAIRIAQRAYPGTSGWLYSCSADEGGWGRWVGYGGVAYSSSYERSDGVGGWLQFRPSTFHGFVRHAISDVRQRGFKVPASAESWLSPLGQALAGAWGITHGQAHHWAGAGC